MADIRERMDVALDTDPIELREIAEGLLTERDALKAELAALHTDETDVDWLADHVSTAVYYVLGRIEPRLDDKVRTEAAERASVHIRAGSVPFVNARVMDLSIDLIKQARADRDEARAELAEARRVIAALPDPGTVEELREKITEIFGDPNEAAVHAFLNYAWSETGRIAGEEMAARWQAEDELAGLRVAIERLTAQRVRAEHFACRPHRCGDEASGMDGKERCHGCHRVWPCPAIAALDAPQRPEDTRGCPKHIGGRVNAEDCPACRPLIDKTVLYPYICPGDPKRPEDTRERGDGR